MQINEFNVSFKYHAIMLNKTKIALFLMLTCGTSALASNWHYTSVGNDDTFYFFDAETLQKNKDGSVIMWVKTVQATKYESDGSWATAIKWNINCPKRTIQRLMWSSYDRDGKFIQSNSTARNPTDVVPDSVGEGMLKMACSPSFPNDKSGNNYFKINNNDPILAARNLVDALKSQVDEAPK